MQNWKLQINLSVADSWVADGFDVKDRLDQIEEHIAGLLPYAYGHEVVVKATILKQPTDQTIQQLQNGELEAQD